MDRTFERESEREFDTALLLGVIERFFEDNDLPIESWALSPYDSAEDGSIDWSTPQTLLLRCESIHRLAAAALAVWSEIED